MTIEGRRDALYKWDGNRPADDDVEYLSPKENRRLVREVMMGARGGRYSGATSASGHEMEDTGTTIFIGGRKLRVMRNVPGKGEEVET